MPKNISEIDFTIFDLETTGLEPELGDRIVEIAAVRLRNKKRLGVFHSLINPAGRVISPAAFAVNKISHEMIKDAPNISEVMPLFLDFISGSCLAAYNAPFDFSFLSSELRMIKKQIPEGLQTVDILTMARRLLSGLQCYTLGFVAESLSIDSLQEHRALSDTNITVEIFNRLNSILNKKGIVDFQQFISLFGLNSQLLNNINNAKIARIQEALDLGVSLKIRYLARHNAEFTERQVTPQAIIQNGKQIYPVGAYKLTGKRYDVSKGDYLVGFCHLRKQERTFMIKNILHLEMSTPLQST